MSADRGVYQPPPEDIQMYDPAEDEEVERSRLPILIVIALLVLAAFGGVVWLAYNQGVARGRADAPRVIAAPSGPVRTAPEEATNGAPASPYAGLKIYDQPVPPEQEAQGTTEAPSPASEMPSQPSGEQTQAAVPPAAQPQPQPQAAPITIAPAPAPSPVIAESAPAPTPVAAAPAHVAAGGGVLLQIGSYPTEAAANAAWTSFQKKHAATLGSAGPDVKSADLGEKGTWYRLRIGPFADKATANTTCAKLKEEGAPACFTAAP